MRVLRRLLVDLQAARVVEQTLGPKRVTRTETETEKETETGTGTVTGTETETETGTGTEEKKPCDREAHGRTD